ncbi:YkgJ family cysteine cluster protein [Luteibacter sahnii]|uniref:YkgJ family cysteine cluster protein n=1 Tax=Luteibacter sahnii TaxID=3021977 RepID=UPI002A6AA7B1|nr:YkgJ family cysteine cluster protein [Luteibacter sp. PPL193]MDY1548027.1 YkgJ family cysteine cluster protein [Luteibacter sp. PPL193]
MKISFSCTMCGRCCHGLRLPLSVDEASQWLARGGSVELFCEAIPWPDEPAPDNGPAAHKRRRSFPAVSGQLPIRVIVSLMASFPDACPNLLPDMRCGIYDERPRACRVYPAEVNPHVPFDPATKLCPPDAWASVATLRDDTGAWTDPEVARSITAMRDADARDARVKSRLCASLGIDVAGLSNEATVVHRPLSERLADALRRAQRDDTDTDGHRDWRLASHRRHTMQLLAQASCHAVDATALPDALAFLGFVPGDEAATGA